MPVSKKTLMVGELSSSPSSSSRIPLLSLMLFIFDDDSDGKVLMAEVARFSEDAVVTVDEASPPTELKSSSGG